METKQLSEEIRDEFLSAIEAASEISALESVRVAVFGKKGRLSELMRSVGGMEPSERQAAGKIFNSLKSELTEALEQRREELESERLLTELSRQAIDVTAPVRPERNGTIHPVTQVLDEVAEIFAGTGFSVAEGPDIETEFHNFTGLNIPPEHPARQMHDTFYFHEKSNGERLVLRTHTSPVQIRTMKVL